MPWKKNDYPVSMKNLEPRVRNKAVEIANALLEDGYEEGRAIAIATAKGKSGMIIIPYRDKNMRRRKQPQLKATNNQLPITSTADTICMWFPTETDGLSR